MSSKGTVPFIKVNITFTNGTKGEYKGVLDWGFAEGALQMFNPNEHFIFPLDNITSFHARKVPVEEVPKDNVVPIK